MATATGTVEVVHEKENRWSIKIDDGSKDGMWLGFNKTKPACMKGDVVTVDYEQSGKFKNADPKSLVVKKNETTGTTGSQDKATAEAKKQSTIEWQSARNSAIEFVKLAVQVEAVKLPAKGDKFDTVLALVNDMTVRFVEEARTQKIKEEPAKNAKAMNKEEE